MLQNVRRSDRAGAKHDFASGAHRYKLAIANDLRTGATQRTVVVALDFELLHTGVSPRREIRPVFDRTQESLRSIPAPAVFLRDLKVADAEIVTLVEIVDDRNARLLRGCGERIKNFPLQALLVDTPLAAASVNLCNRFGIAVEPTPGCRSDRPTGRSREPGHAYRSSR